MKKVIILAAALSAFAPAAFAYTAGELSPSEKSEAMRYAPNVDLDNLTPAQANLIANALTSGDRMNVGAYIYSIVNNG
jgi:hypothetical protein